jgi:DNA-directed RNA polymerase subunit RPC12/RpoP
MLWALRDDSKEDALSRDETETPWWLEPGPETCQHCQGTFHYEAGYHCFQCDSPVCPVCVVELHETRQVSCPDCHAQAQISDDEQSG